MTIKTVTTIHCDDFFCGRALQVEDSTPAEMRDGAKARDGWAHVDGQDLCLRCYSNLMKAPTRFPFLDAWARDNE